MRSMAQRRAAQGRAASAGAASSPQPQHPRHVGATPPRRPSRFTVPRARAEGAAQQQQKQHQEEERFDARAFRRALGRSKTYSRKTSNNPEAMGKMADDGVGYSSSGLVAKMRTEGFAHTVGDVSVILAESYGFCWGVERAVQMAYEARRAFPGRQLHITNEIIHNPTVNRRLEEMEVKFIVDRGGDLGKDFSAVEEGDVVILPAFGASVHEMKLLHERGVNIVDTTCPWVSKVWNAVGQQSKQNHTSIIHGKWAHEETVATASFAGDYVIVKNIPEANVVMDYILNGGDREAFLDFFKNATSEGFDPDTMLERVGVANQTTMLKGETQEIGKLVERTMLRKYGPTELGKHFMILDTICDATQVRQDAMYKLVEEDLDLIVVVGGYNSSNTSHLQEIAEDKGIPSYWLDTAQRVGPGNTVEFQNAAHDLVTVDDWLPAGPIKVGVTSGASTPDKVVEDVLDKIFALKDPTFEAGSLQFDVSKEALEAAKEGH